LKNYLEQVVSGKNGAGENGTGKNGTNRKLNKIGISSILEL